MPELKLGLDVERLMAGSHVDAGQVAWVEGGKPAAVRTWGAADEDTVFQAASLSKPLFAYAVLQLVDGGVLSLDAPLAGYLPGYLGSDGADITARHVLTHATGLPNWRSDALPLRAYFRPGSRFSYAGEGFRYLQAVVETLVGEPLEEIAQRLVFRPLGMACSSFERERLAPGRLAAPHDSDGRVFATPLPPAANAAASLHTTARDYASFLAAALGGQRLLPTTARTWMEPVVRPARLMRDGLDPRQVAPLSTAIAWGLGWGIEIERRAVFHWGDNPGFKAFAYVAPRERTAAVILTNGDGGAAVAACIAKALFGGPIPSLTWLGWD